MGCVRGAVRFVSLEGYRDGRLKCDVIVTIWTLMPDVWEWKKDVALRVGDLWDCEDYLRIGLPRLEPTCPVLDMHEDDTVHVLLSDFKFVGEQFDCRGDFVGKDLEKMYVLRLDVRNKKILSSAKCSPETPTLPHLFASEFSAYLNKRTARNLPNRDADEVGNEGTTSHRGYITSLRFTMFEY